MIWTECKAALNYADSKIPQLPDLGKPMSKTTNQKCDLGVTGEKKRGQEYAQILVHVWVLESIRCRRSGECQSPLPTQLDLGRKSGTSMPFKKFLKCPYR